jgi:hypothetical protein
MTTARPTLLFLTTIIIAAVFFVIRPAAATTSTVMGTAWWGTQSQYVYIDCSNDVTGDRLDDPYNLCGGLNPLGNPLLCAPYIADHGFHLYSAPCSSLVHHVYIDNSGNFSGSAWNATRGLINFFATTTPPDSYAFTSGCPQPNTCLAANNCSACYNESTLQVHGWAQVAGDGTWIKLDSTQTATTTNIQMQSWNAASSTSPYYSLNPGDFIGDATTNSLGSISFNCLSEGGAGGTCATRPYKVYVSNLQVGHMSAPNWSYYNACHSGALQAVLTWNIKSGVQNGYEVVVNSANHFSTSTNDYVCWSGVKYPSVAAQYTLPNADPNCHPLSYNTNYYWWVRLFDASGTPTQWYQFGSVDGHNGAADTHTNTLAFDGNQNTFKTYRHEFPVVKFSWSPTPVLVGTTTNFTSQPNSYYYTSAAPTSPQSCGSPACIYGWSTTDVYALIGSSTAATTTIIFQQATSTTVSLQITDSDNYYCSTSTPSNFNASYNLPIWREIKAQ